MQQIKISFSQTIRQNKPSRCLSQVEHRDIKPQKQSIYSIQQSPPLNRFANTSLKLPRLNNLVQSPAQVFKRTHKPRLTNMSLPMHPTNPQNTNIIKEQKSQMIDDLRQKLHTLSHTLNKNNELKQITEVAQRLKQTNSLFNKLDEFIICCLLRCSIVKIFKKKSYIYSKGDASKQFFIILNGSVKLSNKKQQFKKVCKSGQTLSEQVIFQTKKQNDEGKVEYAKALAESMILEVNVGVYKSLSDQFNRTGKKHEAKVLEALLWRNYLSKQAVRKSRFI